MEHKEKTFNPINYGFKWVAVEGNEYGWYEFDSTEAHRQAKADRDFNVKILKEEQQRTATFGQAILCNVRRHSLKNQLMKRGGIGSGHPEIEELVTVYSVTWEE